MNTGRRLWIGTLAVLSITLGSVAPGAVIDDFTVALNTGFIGTGVNPVTGDVVTAGATPDPLVFQSQSVVGIGSFDAQRTVTLTYANPMDVDEYSLLRVTPNTPSLRFENSSGQFQAVDFLLRYDNFGFSSGGGQTVDFSGWDAIQFEVISTNDFTTPPSLPAVWTLYDVVGSSSTIAVTGVGLYNVSFANFGAIDLTQISAVEFGFSNHDGQDVFQNLDIRFSQLSVIPVPPSAGLILLGMAGLGLRRTMKRR